MRWKIAIGVVGAIANAFSWCAQRAIGAGRRRGMTGKRVMQLVAVAGMAMAAAACNGSNPPDPPPPVATSQPAPSPVTTSPVTTSPPAPAAGLYESTCYYKVGILGEGLAMSLNGQTADCADAAAAFENAIGNAYAVTAADDSVVQNALCGGTISGSAGNYTVTVYPSPGTGINSAVGSQDPVCIKLGWMNLRLGGRCPAEGCQPRRAVAPAVAALALATLRQVQRVGSSTSNTTASLCLVLPIGAENLPGEITAQGSAVA